jgi:hypothetical protein
MFITYNAFIQSQYNEACENKVIKNIYRKAGGFKAFKRNYIKCYGFAEYLVSIRGAELSAIQTYHIAKMFIVYGKRSASTLPMVLVSVSRQYDIEYPTVPGILSKNYWQSRFDSALLA